MKVEAKVADVKSVDVTVTFTTSIERMNQIADALNKGRSQGMFGPVFDLEMGIRDVTNKMNKTVGYEPSKEG